MLGFGFAPPAGHATTVTINDTVLDVAYQGAAPTGWFGGSSLGDVIGDGFDTRQIAVDRHGSAGGLVVDFRFYTGFSGVDRFGDTCARYADLFLRSPGSGFGPGAFNYALVLGYQQANGGLTQAGLYRVSAFATSQDIWSPRTGFIYGGAYLPQGSGASPQLAPTVLTTGLKLADAVVTQTPLTDGYLLDARLTLTGLAANALGGQFDLLWGTGDCANDTVFGTPNAVPEPGTLALFVGFLGVLTFLGRRRRRPS